MKAGLLFRPRNWKADKLLVSTTKLYKKNFDKKEAWPNYVAFLEAGYKFSQAKIVLKKKVKTIVYYYSIPVTVQLKLVLSQIW